MKIAVQEKLLPGESVAERLESARSMGFDGVEFDADDLGDNLLAAAEALQQTGLQAAAVNLGGTHLLHPDFAERDRAVVRIRRAMGDALDLGAGGVVFLPLLPTTPRLPDLHPYKSDIELEAELLVKLLRATLLDLAYAMGAQLYLMPVNRDETHLIQRLEHAARIISHNDNHPHLKIAANLYHQFREEDDMNAALRAYSGRIAYAQMTDDNRRAPGRGSIDFPAAVAALRDGGYDGWLTVACEDAVPEDLRKSLDLLRRAAEA
jgi:sugar phosphate isomerase/epimerase